MKYIKNSKQITSSVIEAIIPFLKREKDNWFNDGNKATSYEDFKRFNSYTDNEHLIEYGGLCLIDIYCNEMWICKHQKRIVKLQDSRKVRFKPITRLISNCQKDLGSVWNGYWMIPNLKYWRVNDES